MIEEYRKKVQEATDFIKAKSSIEPEYGLILGSGLGSMAEEVEEKVVIPYSEIPHFKVSTAPSHVGRLVIGKLAGKNVMVMQGRVHLYEGYEPKEVTFPVRVMKALGVKTLFATCAAGGLNRNFKAGDFMILKDHLNMTNSNPLIGPNDPEIGARFPVMFDAYNTELREKAKEIALNQKIYLHEGVYFGIAGPVFTTRAEARLAIQSGADAVGMSMVHEVIIARHAGLKVIGIANITDMALPDVEGHASEDEIIETANKSGAVFKQLVKSIIAEI